MMQGSEKRFLSIPEFCDRYGIGRTKLYQEIADRRLQTVKIGRSTRVPISEAETWERLVISEALATSESSKAA